MIIDISKGWMPDFQNAPFAAPEGSLLVCKNLLPLDSTYGPALNPVDYSSSALSGTPTSIQEFSGSSETSYSFIGTLTKIYRMAGVTLTDVTRSSGGAYTATVDQWKFAGFGDWIIATNYIDVPQILKGITAANFTALGGTPPRAKYVLVLGSYTIFAYTKESSVVYPKRVRWSGFEDPESWAESKLTGASYQDLYDATGDIIGLAPIGTQAFAIFHRNSITMAYLTHVPYTFTFAMNKIKNIPVIENSMIPTDDGVYFLSDDDIYFYNGNDALQPLGFGVRGSVLPMIDMDSTWKMTTGHDPSNHIVYWSIQTTSAPNARPDMILCYNYAVKKFSYIMLDHYILGLVHSGALLMDAIDSIYPDISDMPYPLDSNKYAASAFTMAIVNPTSAKVARLIGTPLEGTIETPDYNQEGAIMMLRRVRPKIQGYTDLPIIYAGYRFNEDDGVAYTAGATVSDSSGYATLRASGRYLRLRMTTGQHQGISHSIEVEAIERGKR